MWTRRTGDGTFNDWPDRQDCDAGVRESLPDPDDCRLGRRRSDWRYQADVVPRRARGSERDRRRHAGRGTPHQRRRSPVPTGSMKMIVRGRWSYSCWETSRHCAPVLPTCCRTRWRPPSAVRSNLRCWRVRSPPGIPVALATRDLEDSCFCMCGSIRESSVVAPEGQRWREVMGMATWPSAARLCDLSGDAALDLGDDAAREVARGDFLGRPGFVDG